jgi:hypothetical protein
VETNAKQRNRQKRLEVSPVMASCQTEVENRTVELIRRGLIAALRLKIAEIAPDERLIEEHLIDVILQEALRRKHVPTVELIFDRLEGRSRRGLKLPT